MESYTEFLAALTALLAALAPIYVMAWKTTRTSKKAADQATLANDAVNNTESQGPRMVDNVMELVNRGRAQTKLLEQHAEDIQRNGQDLKVIQGCWNKTVQRLDGIAATCCALQKEGGRDAGDATP